MSISYAVYKSIYAIPYTCTYYVINHTNTLHTYTYTRAFPCWDEPAMKATFSVTLTVPPQLTVLSNMPEVSMVMVKDNKGGMLKKVRYFGCIMYNI